MNNLTFGNERHQHYETLCGGSGAGNGFNGTSAVHTHMTNSRLTDAEILESRFPVRLERFEIRSGSGGLGKWSGGDGIVREISFLEPMTVALLANRHEVPPRGLEGGGPGACGRAGIRKANGELLKFGARDKANLDTGDSVIIETPGGGGFGKA
jgi:5-oxoprolinase (ATP-hydrolysing)